MITAVALTATTALGLIDLGYGHIGLSIPTIVFTIFTQAFVMFFFIGVSRLCENVQLVLESPGNLEELFDELPKDLAPYKKKTARFVLASTLSKRQTIPWTMLMLALGVLGFLLGAAHDTGMVRKIIHSGVIYGFIVAMIIGFVRQWIYLGKSHKLLRELKTLFGMSSNSM